MQERSPLLFSSRERSGRHIKQVLFGAVCFSGAVVFLGFVSQVTRLVLLQKRGISSTSYISTEPRVFRHTSLLSSLLRA